MSQADIGSSTMKKEKVLSSLFYLHGIFIAGPSEKC